LLQVLRQRLRGSTALAFVFNSTLPFDELLRYVLEDFGARRTGRSPAERLMALNTFLIERRQANQNAVLVIDEAQNLNPATLEEVRLLSNFETASDKLLQIVMVGQPELRAKLQLPQLRQLRQRIGLRCEIGPLEPTEIRDYIRARLRVAGAADLAMFDPRAISHIAKYSDGVPRLINLVCDHCLVLGYAEQKRRIGPDTARAAIEYLETGERPRKSWRGVMTKARWPTWAVGALAAMVFAAAAATVWSPGGHDFLNASISGLLAP
jgi:type II secretory pathway predicted ATPase ExeA